MNTGLRPGHRLRLLEGGRELFPAMVAAIDRARRLVHVETYIFVFANAALAVAEAAGGSLADAVKLNIYLTDLANFAKVNEVMSRYFAEPYPARAAVGVKELPRGAVVEADAVLVLG